MTPTANPDTGEAGFDQTLVFTLPHEDASGRIVRLGPVLDIILSAHAYPPVVERLLAEALVLTALLGSTLKPIGRDTPGKDGGGQVTIQAQTDNGPISLLVCDYLGGQLRGHCAFDLDRLAEVGPDPTLFALFGKGFLAITIDDGASGERYQGIVPLEGVSLADAAEQYFRQSVQLPTVVRIAMRHDPGAPCIAAGVMVQQLAAGEIDGERIEVRDETTDLAARWAHIAALAETMTPAELTDPALSMEALVWRLYHDEAEVRVTHGPLLTRGCRCNPAYLATVIARFPIDDRAAMQDEVGNITIDCAFCSRQFVIDPAASVTLN